MPSGLATGFALDRRWHWMTSGIERSKRPDLLLLARVLAEAETPYALIGGLALQVHQAEPRTTLDIDLAVPDRALLPAGRLIQVTDDSALAEAVTRAESIVLEGVPLQVLGRPDLLREKLRAAADPARRRSKRVQDLADALALVEADPALARGLTATERALLERAP
jgi:hypothetical protein